MRLVLLLGLLAGCTGTTLHGQLVDALNADAPLAGEVVIARAVGTVELTCQTLTGITDEDGRFAIPGLCVVQTAYLLEAANKSLLLADADTVDSAGRDLLIHAWWAPATDGAYVLRGRDLTPLGTNVELRSVQVGDEAVVYPTTMPDAPQVVLPTDHVVFTGTDAATYVIAPLIPSPAVTIGELAMEPWSYVGARFTAEGAVERVPAVPDAAKVRDVMQVTRVARFVAGDALPPGTYVVHSEGSHRAAIVQFGEPPNLPTPEPRIPEPTTP